MIVGLVFTLALGPLPQSGGVGAVGVGAVGAVGQGAAPSRVERWLCHGRIHRFRVSPYGGTSLKVMLDFGSGRRAVFKPEQTLYSARYQAEIVAYRLARRLGVRTVPPACERRVRFAALERLFRAPRHAARLERLRKEVRRDSAGWVTGAAIWFVRRAHELDLAHATAWQRWLRPGASIPARHRRRAGELADLLLLDLLFTNPDRFTGGNVLVNLASKRLVMIDNAASFRPRMALTLAYHRKELALLGRVRRPTYRALLALDADAVRRAIARPSGGGRYLSTLEERAILERRIALIGHVEALRRRFGDAAVFLP